METSNPVLWLAWALFGSYFALLVWRKYLPAVRQAPPLPKPAVPAVPAWLFCEEGTTLDRRVRWFPLRPGGKTIVGSRPRSATEEAAYVYLTADDIREDHAALRFNPETGRYELQALDGSPVLHNNEPLPPAQAAELADGDTLDLGRISRFRFTLSGPEED